MTMIGITVVVAVIAFLIWAIHPDPRDTSRNDDIA
jgi:hypothetical protein